MNIVEKFKQLIKERDYIAVAKLYSGYAYMHQKEFNQILDDNNIKENIFDIIHKVTDSDIDPAGGRGLYSHI
jgi:hypothetical protein